MDPANAGLIEVLTNTIRLAAEAALKGVRFSASIHGVPFEVAETLKKSKLVTSATLWAESSVRTRPYATLDIGEVNIFTVELTDEEARTVASWKDDFPVEVKGKLSKFAEA